ncbi:MAG TPA: hypothetical protein G4O02_12045 [Caldilineae bacterium]|nr:hypothetical protein [Caldilineae bacterium]
MFQDIYYIPKRTGTYSDVLVAYGLAALLNRIFQQVKGPHETWRITLEDGGSHYLLRLSEPVREEWLDRLSFFRSPAYYLTRNEADPVPPDTNARDVSATREQVRAYREQRRTLRGEGVRGSELEQWLQDLEPPRDWAVVVFAGEGRMQAAWAGGREGSYNRVVKQWVQLRPFFAETIRAILEMFSIPDPSSETSVEIWAKIAREAGLRMADTASQLLNPHQGKGQNQLKANMLRMDNMSCPWPEEFLKAVGLWHCMAPRQVMDSNDWKVYTLAPLRLSWRIHEEAFRKFNQYLWRERGQATSLKADITSVLLFTRAWLDYVAAASRDELSVILAEADIAPERAVAGFHVAQFKLLSRNAYTMVNLSFLNLPAWSGDLQTRADVTSLQQVIDEHLEVIRRIDEDRSDGFDLLRRYRDFVAGNKWDAFFDFLVGYSHELMRRLNEGDRWVPMFSPSGLRRLIMASRKELLPIVQNPGFQNVAYAIRHSTVIPQSRKARGQEFLYEIRYGLGAELKRKATVRDEFIAALSDFMHSYNRENAQVLENRKQQMRRDLRTTDIEEIVRLVDEYGSEVVANLLVAYGYAREPRDEEGNGEQGADSN